MDPAALPIRQFADQITKSVKANPVTVVIGETGSGKTTQISQILLEAGFADGGGIIGVTQPRRVAAVMVARRVAQERKVELGTEVGYAVRFEERTSRQTKIKYMTDGTLLRECLEDAQLSKYSVLILDEAHERSLNTDIMFGLLKQLSSNKSTRKTPLKLVVTSATLESAKVSEYFNNCPVFHVPGRAFPVDIIQSMEDHTKDYQAAVVDTVVDLHCTQPEGDILVFLTGQAEIDKAIKDINAVVKSLPAGSCGDLQVLPLYAALPPDMQARVFTPSPPGIRRCVVATNIAETSVTVAGVVYVVDPGLVKQKDYNPRTGMDSLAVVPISRVQATQRAGRAGRTRPGKCFRLYTKKYFEREMSNTTPPEIMRTSLVNAVLYLKSLPLNIDVLAFDYLDRPKKEALEDALRQLYVLDAIDIDGKITPVGSRMSLLPLDPSLSRALIASKELGCVREMMTLAAMLSIEGSSVFVGNKGPEQLIKEAFQQSAGSGMEQVPVAGYQSGYNPQRSNTQQTQQQVQRISEDGRALLKELMKDGLGDHILLLKMYQAWEQAGYDNEWCRELVVDSRSMRFAKDIRQQLERILGEDGSGLDDKLASEKNGGEEDDDDRPAKKHKTSKSSSFISSSKTITNLRMALTIGFANRLAHRMPMHNGYRTLSGESPALAQLHPSCALVAADEDGLLPEWLVYHELIATGRTFLSKVCPVESEWVQQITQKLQNINVARLSGGATTQQQQGAAAEEQDAQKDKLQNAAGQRQNADSEVDAARARYLARKAAAAATGGKRK